MTTEVTRRPLHRRNIDVQGYLRSDGLWEVEGLLADTKSYEMNLIDKGLIAVGDHLHQMVLTLAVDDGLVIREVRVQMNATPYLDCPGASVQYQQLVGLQIRSGWMDEAKQRLGRVTGCTHLTEMLPVLATAALQTIRGYHLSFTPGFSNGSSERKSMLGSCYGFREGGRAQQRLWPDTAPSESAADT